MVVSRRSPSLVFSRIGIALLAGALLGLGGCGPYDWTNELERCDRTRNPVEAEKACAIATKDMRLSQRARATAFYVHSLMLMVLDRFPEGTQAADQSIALGRADSAVFNQRAWGRYKTGDLPGALADAEKAVALDPKDAYARDTRGHIHKTMGRRELAIADFRAALAIDPAYGSPKDGLRELGVTR